MRHLTMKSLRGSIRPRSSRGKHPPCPYCEAHDEVISHFARVADQIDKVIDLFVRNGQSRSAQGWVRGAGGEADMTDEKNEKERYWMHIASGTTPPQRPTDPPCPVGPQGAAGPSGPPPPSCSSGVTFFDGPPIEYTPEQLAAFAEDPLRYGEWDDMDFWNND